MTDVADSSGVGSRPVVLETIARQRFRNRAEDLQRHIQLVDASLRVVIRLARSENHRSIATAAGFGLAQYPRLNEPPSEAKRVAKYSRARNAEAAIVQLFRYTSDYFREVLALIYRHDPLMVVGKALGQPSLSFREIVQLGGWDELCQRMVEEVFRSLENERSTPKLMDKLVAKTGVSIPAGLKADALAFLELRHLIIHREGLLDAAYESAYADRASTMTSLPRERFVAGQRVPGTTAVVASAFAKVGELIAAIDHGLIEQGIAPPRAVPRTAPTAGTE